MKTMSYEKQAYLELEEWKKTMKKKPNILDKASKGVQNKINGILPEQYHNTITYAIKHMVRVVLAGSEYSTKAPMQGLSLMEREKLVDDKLTFYKTTAMVEGATTGMGGILLGLADLPLLLGIKIKFLYDIAAIYGFDVSDYRERLYVLNIIQLAFSSKKKRRSVFNRLESFDQYASILPEDINAFEWRSFQQEYRDYLDISKLLQMVPGVGAIVGAYVNTSLLGKLGETAKNAYRMRIYF